MSRAPSFGRRRRMRWALETIGTRCTSSTGPSTCVDDPSRSPDAYYGAERWCEGCIAREGLRRVGLLAGWRAAARSNHRGWRTAPLTAPTVGFDDGETH